MAVSRAGAVMLPYTAWIVGSGAMGWEGRGVGAANTPGILKGN
jgi:hypothetical protein